jgi:hypothetical protein
MFSKALKYFLSVWMFLAMSTSLSAGVVPQAESPEAEAAPLDVKELILEHLKDDYEWHIATYKDKDISIPLPVILFSKNSGVQLFSSAKFHQNKGYYKGFYISKSGKYGYRNVTSCDVVFKENNHQKTQDAADTGQGDSQTEHEFFSELFHRTSWEEVKQMVTTPRFALINPPEIFNVFST